MLAEKWIDANAKLELSSTQMESTFSKLSSSIAENFVGFMNKNQTKNINVASSSGTNVKTIHDNVVKTKTYDELRFDSQGAIFFFFFSKIINKEYQFFFFYFSLFIRSIS